MFWKRRKIHISEGTKEKLLRYVEDNYRPSDSSEVSGSSSHVQLSQREPRYSVEDEFEGQHVQFQVWDEEEEDTFSSLLKTSLSPAEAKTLDLLLEKRKDRTFSETLLDMIGQQGQKDSYIYKQAQIDRRLFSKIIGDRHYKPAKDTVLAFAFALRCNLEGANQLLQSAGYLLSYSSKRDIILEYCFKNKIYDLIYINALLSQLNQKIIGRENVG